MKQERERSIPFNRYRFKDTMRNFTLQENLNFQGKCAVEKKRESRKVKAVSVFARVQPIRIDRLKCTEYGCSKLSCPSISEKTMRGRALY